MAADQNTARAVSADGKRYSLVFGAHTDAAGREANEDSCTSELQRRSDKGYLGVLAAIADGMGGGASGRTASTIAIGTVSEEYFEAGSAQPLANLQQAVNAANSAVYAYSISTHKTSTVGTTMIAAAVVGDQVYITSVGDSRAYLVRAGEARQLTCDQNWAQQQVELGRMSRAEAEAHENAALLTHVLGQGPNIQMPLTGQPDNKFSFQFELRPGDTLVLCSDGLSNVLTPANIAATAVRQAAPRAAVALVRQAKAQHTSDNATALVLQYGLRPHGAIFGRLQAALIAVAIIAFVAVLLFSLSQPNAATATPPTATIAATATLSPPTGTPNRITGDSPQASQIPNNEQLTPTRDVATSTPIPATPTSTPEPPTATKRPTVRPTRRPTAVVPPTALATPTETSPAPTEVPTAEPAPAPTEAQPAAVPPAPAEAPPAEPPTQAAAQ